VRVSSDAPAEAMGRFDDAAIEFLALCCRQAAVSKLQRWPLAIGQVLPSRNKSRFYYPVVPSACSAAEYSRKPMARKFGLVADRCADAADAFGIFSKRR